MDEQREQDAHLLRKALAGDAAAFGDLYERYLDAIHSFVFCRVNGQQEAEDLTEAVFLQAWQALDKNPPREAPFHLWLYRIAHNAIIDHYRLRKDLISLDSATHLSDPVESPEAFVTRQERTDALKQMIQQLKEDHQQVLACRFVIGLSHAETAVVMERSEEAVRALQYRAVSALRNLLIVQGSHNV